MVHAALLALATLSSDPVPANPAEYEVTRHAAGWEASNPAQGFRVAFTGEGMGLVPSEAAAEPAWEWGLTLLRYGRPGSLQPVATGALAPSGPRAERARPGIVEWYINCEEGLEHGFTITAPPRPSRANSEVFIEMALSGSLSPTFSTDGRAIDFRGAHGAYLRYAKLEVVDAAGRRLEARMEGFAEPGVRGIRIRFDDDGARYPVTVDPMTTTTAWTVESDQNNAQLGIGLSSAGDVNGDGYSDVIVSAPIFAGGTFNEGKVWIYHGSPSGPSASAAWSMEGEQFNAQLGTVVETAGDVNGDGYGDVLIGSPNFDVAGMTDAGKIDLYLGSVTGLAATPVWTSAGTASSQGFGGSVASAGDVNADGFDDVLVGEANYTNGQSSEGRALLYLGSASGLATTSSWSVEGNRADAVMGWAVASAGDVDGDGYGDVIVGAALWSNGQEAEGRADVYLGSASGLATTPVWTTESNQAFAEFGVSVGTAGDVNGDGYADIIVGADTYTNGQTAEGAAFVYLGSPTGPAATPAWSTESNQGPTPGFNDPTYYGGSVSTAGDVNGDGYADVIVGATRYDSPTQDEGAAFLYLGGPAGLSTTHALRFESNQLAALFGRTVRGAGDVNGDGFADLLVSSTLYDNGQTNEGRAWLYLGAAAVPGIVSSLLGEGEQTFAYHGVVVASAGDVDGDGYSDGLVVTSGYNGPPNAVGRVSLHRGTSAGLALTPAWTTLGDQADEGGGTVAASAGDVNGDGYSDVVVGTREFDNANAAAGRVRLYLGSAAGLAVSPVWTVEGAAFDERVGRVVASAGDVNGDGLSDLLVLTAPDLELYFGSPSGIPQLAWTGPSPAGDGYPEPLVASAGDVNGDGRSDVILGLPLASNGQSNEGQALLFFGTTSGLTAAPVWSVESNQAEAFLGTAVASAGDVNGDGYADVIVGATQMSGPLGRVGTALVYHGSASGPATTPAVVLTGSDSFDYFGWGLAGLGDINLDGYADVAVGEPLSSGRLHVFLGSASGVSPTPAITLTRPGADDDYFGLSVANAGDVNGDGFPDLIAGAPLFSNDVAIEAEGAAYLYFGSGIPAVERRPLALQLDGSGPLHFLGKSTSETGFRITERGFSPAGRCRIRLEWELEPLGAPFDGVGSGSTPWTDTGAPGPSGSAVQYSEIVSGLQEGKQYKWRTRIVSDHPLFPRSPWKSMPNNAITETKLRTAGCVDVDGDGYGSLLDGSCLGAAIDCNDANGLVWATPGPTTDLLFTSKTDLSWSAPSQLGTAASEIRYDTLRSTSVANFDVCVESNDGPNRVAADATIPAPGGVLFYVNRARNSCSIGLGSLGTTSAGAERVGSVCP